MSPAPTDSNSAHLALLYRISSVVSSALSLQEMLEQLIGMAISVTNCDACLVYLPAQSGDELVLRASQLRHSGEIGAVRIRRGEGVTGWVLEHRSVVALSRNAYADERFKRFPALVEDTYEAFLSAPLMSGGDVVGVINIHHKEPHAYRPDEVALVLFLGEQMGGAIAKAALEAEKQDAEQRLETRKVIERAKGILQRAHGLSEEEAYLRIRRESRRSRRPMRQIAETIIATDSQTPGA